MNPRRLVLDAEPAITAGTATQYWRGDKTWQELTTAVVSESGNLYFTTARARASITGTSPVDYNSTTGVISMAAATSLVNGYLTSTDWSAFNAKQAALTGSVSGTANQVDVTANSNSVASNITLSTPQDIHTSASPTFASVITPQIGIAADPDLMQLAANSLTVNGDVYVLGADVVGDGSNLRLKVDSTNYIDIRPSVIFINLGGWEYGISDTALYPYSDSSNNLGSSTKYWANTYTDSLKLNSTAILSGANAGRIGITGTLDVFTMTAGNAITGNLTGNVTGNCSGTAATVTGAAQAAITSLGTLTGLTMGGNLAMGNYDITGLDDICTGPAPADVIFCTTLGGSAFPLTNAYMTAASITTLTMSAGSIVTDTTTGLKIGTATTQKIGLYNATPVVQHAHMNDPGATVAALAAWAANINILLENIGINASA